MTNLLITGAFWIAFFLLSCDSTNTDRSKTDVENPLVENPPKDSTKENGMPVDHEMFNIMKTMVDKVNQMSIATDLDLNFVNAMIIHHQAGIDLAQIEIAKGQNEEMKAMARDFIASQTTEIKKLKELLHHHKPEVSADQSQTEIHAAMNEMMYKLKKVIVTGNTDKDFAMLMIPHHENAVDIAAEEVINGHHVQFKLFARDMIREKNEEIGELKDWLDAH